MSDQEGVKEFRYIVRIAGTDLPGELPIVYALSKIKGIGYKTANAICRKLGIDPRTRLGTIDEAMSSEIEKYVIDLTQLKLPSWMYNRRKDIETGRDLHLIGADLIFAARNDIERMIRTKSWKGIRHALGLKVRGQRTVTTGRLGVTVGVRKKRS